MKLGKLIDDKFQEALDKINLVPLPIGVAYALKGATKTIRSEYLRYEEARLQGLKKYSKKNENGDMMVDENLSIIFESPEEQMNYMKDLEELLNIDINLQKITIEFKDMQGAKLTAQDLAYLEDFIDFA